MLIKWQTEKQQQVAKKPKEPQQVTTKDPKKVEAGKRLAAINCKKREEHRSCYSSGSDRQSWLLHLSFQEKPRNQGSHDASLPTTPRK